MLIRVFLCLAITGLVQSQNRPASLLNLLPNLSLKLHANSDSQSSENSISSESYERPEKPDGFRYTYSGSSNELHIGGRPNFQNSLFHSTGNRFDDGWKLHAGGYGNGAFRVGGSADGHGNFRNQISASHSENSKSSIGQLGQDLRNGVSGVVSRVAERVQNVKDGIVNLIPHVSVASPTLNFSAGVLHNQRDDKELNYRSHHSAGLQSGHSLSSGVHLSNHIQSDSSSGGSKTENGGGAFKAGGNLLSGIKNTVSGFVNRTVGNNQGSHAQSDYSNNRVHSNVHYRGSHSTAGNPGVSIHLSGGPRGSASHGVNLQTGHFRGSYSQEHGSNVASHDDSRNDGQSHFSLIGGLKQGVGNAVSGLRHGVGNVVGGLKQGVQGTIEGFRELVKENESSKPIETGSGIGLNHGSELGVHGAVSFNADSHLKDRIKEGDRQNQINLGLSRHLDFRGDLQLGRPN